MTQARTVAEGISYFPGDYRWSSALQMALTNSTSGGGELGEIDKVVQRLRGHVGDDDAWFEEWRRMGDHVRELGQAAEAAGHRLTAAGAYLRATAYYQVGERFRTPKDEASQEVFKASVDSFKKHASVTERPRIEVVEVPYEGGSLPGYFVHAENSDVSPPPCVGFFDGLDITKELQYMRGVQELVRRGISCLVMDGPGTGEAIRFRGLFLRHDYEVAGTATVDYLQSRPDVDPGRIGIMAVSLGGYYASRCGSLEKRFKACVAWGAIWDYYATWKKRIDAGFKTALSVPGHHISWILGVDTLDEALKGLEGFRLDGVVQQMECSFLVTHGEKDAQIPLDDAWALYNAVGSRDKTIRVFTEEEGGSEHCQRDNPTLGQTFIFDWLQEKL